MEYPPNPEKCWEVRVYDHKQKGIYYERGLRYEEAKKVAERYFGREDVDRVVCCEEGFKDDGI